MVLIRLITLEAMKWNVRISCKFVPSESNILADSLSRGQIDRFWKHTHKEMNEKPMILSSEIWPPTKIWLK